MAAIGKAVVRSKKEGDFYKISTILIHPQHTGLAKNKKTGKKIPAHFVSDVTVQLAGKEILTMECKPALSKNPFISFYAKGDSSTPLKVTWKDNKGQSYEKATKLK